MSDQAHQEWEELTAASVLDALDPDDVHRLSAHVATCDICQRDLDDYNLIAAQLGSLADDEEAAPSWQQMRTAVLGGDSGRIAAPETSETSETSGHVEAPEHFEGQSAPESAPVIPIARRSSRAALWRRPNVLAAAAAVVLLVAGGLVGWKLSTRSTPASATAAVTACQQQSGCRVVRLRSGSVTESAAVIIDAGHASVVPLALANAPAGRMYVLWQLPKDGGGMVPIQSFTSAKRQTVSTQLPHAYDDTVAFAVSLEPAGLLPTKPSGILALGSTT